MITKIILVTFFKIPIIYISVAYKLWINYLYFFRNLDENQKFAVAKSFFHGMTVGSLKFSFNFYFFFFFFGFWFWFIEGSIPKVKEPGYVRSEMALIRSVLACLVIFICCGLPLLKWKHNTITTYGQNLSIVLIQLQILTCWHYGREKMAERDSLVFCLTFLAPLIWSVASRLIHIFICMCSYLHQKCTN